MSEVYRIQGISHCISKLPESLWEQALSGHSTDTTFLSFIQDKSLLEGRLMPSTLGDHLSAALSHIPHTQHRQYTEEQEALPVIYDGQFQEEVSMSSHLGYHSSASCRYLPPTLHKQHREVHIALPVAPDIQHLGEKQLSSPKGQSRASPKHLSPIVPKQGRGAYKALRQASQVEDAAHIQELITAEPWLSSIQARHAAQAVEAKPSARELASEQTHTDTAAPRRYANEGVARKSASTSQRGNSAHTSMRDHIANVHADSFKMESLQYLSTKPLSSLHLMKLPGSLETQDSRQNFRDSTEALLPPPSR